ncbi:MAG: IPT/TIG domain-containing protein [Thermoplasmata archaeon]
MAPALSMRHDPLHVGEGSRRWVVPIALVRLASIAVLGSLILAAGVMVVLPAQSGSTAPGAASSAPFHAFGAGPTITVIPAQGPVGAAFTVNGSGFTPLAVANVTFAGVPLVPTSSSLNCSNVGSSVTTNSSGEFSCPFAVPTEAAGSYNVTGNDTTTVTLSNTVVFLVTVPTISITPQQGPIGSAFTVNATGFSVASPANVTFGGTTIAPTGGIDCSYSTTVITTDANGNFSCSFAAPSEGSVGPYEVVGNDTATSTLSNEVAFALTAVSIIVLPSQGPVGAAVEVSGTGYSVLTPVASLVFDGVTVSTCASGSLTTNATGGFSCGFAVPIGTTGTSVVATDAGGQYATGTFSVTVPAIAVTPTQGPTGLTAMVSGTGFTPNTGISSFEFNGTTPGTQTCTAQTTSATGGFSCTFIVPSDAAGGYNVVATGSDAGSDTATTTFTITLPTLTLSPTQGPSGVTVTASGTGFTPGVTITFTISAGGTIGSASSCTVSGTGSFSACTFTLSGAAATYTVTATGSDGSFDAGTASFHVTTPAITLTPTRGPTGITVTVSGTGFTPNTGISSLKFSGATPGTQTCTSQTTSATGTFSCTFTVPSDSAGGHAVVATGSDGGSDTATATFTITTPTITLTPSQGPTGITVTVSGTGFTPNTGISSLKFSGATPSTQTCTSQTTSATGTFSCTFTVPSDAAGGHAVVATGSDGGSDTATATFTITTPTITLTPSQGPSGITVTVSGAGFTPNTGISTFKFNGVTPGTQTCTAQSTSGTGTFSCTFTVPSDAAGGHSVTATGSDGGSDTASTTFTITTGAITLSPSQGPTGITVTVSGTGFTPNTAIATFTFDGVTPGTQTCTSQTTSGTGTFGCSYTVPLDAAVPYSVVATGSDGGSDTATTTFTITTPAISLSPTQGPSGVTVTVSGTGFTPNIAISTLKFNGASPGTQTCTSQTISATGTFSCTFTVPSDPAGPYNVVATGSDAGSDSATATFTVTTEVITVGPQQGPVGATFTVSGSGFTPDGGVTVAFGSTSLTASSCSVGTPGAEVIATAVGLFDCTFNAPTDLAGPYGVVATDVTTATTSNSITFTVTTPAIVVSPTQGPLGATVTVSGTGFSVSTALTSLVFDGVTVSSCTSGSLTTGATGAFSCTFTVPSGTSGTTVTATDVGGQDGTGAFTVTTPAITVTPGQGPIGATVTVAGTGFSVSTALASLVFDGITIASCTSGSLTSSGTGAFSCTFSVPSGTSGTTVTATDVGGQDATGTFTLTTPSITGTPGQGPVGATVTVSGTGFSVSTALASLVFDGVTISSCTSGSLTTGATGAFSCVFKAPSGTSGTTVTATDAGGQDATGVFTVTTPAISATPGQGPIGATVTVAGTGFSISTALASLVFDGVTVSTCTSGSLTTSATGTFSCTFSVPSGTFGTSVVATDAGGQPAFGTFTVTAPAIVVSPTQGPLGTIVTVSGTGFSVSTTLTALVFDGVTISSCTAGSLVTGPLGAFSCAIAVPSGSSGTDVVATDTGGQVATTLFSVTVPTISVTPAQGTIGSTFSLVGSGFQASSAATISSGGVDLGPTSCSAGTFSGTTITTTGTGGFSCTFLVSSQPGGTITLTATQGTNVAPANFLVTSSFTISSGSGAVGTVIGFVGSGFLASTPYTVEWNTSTPLCTGTTTATGQLSCSSAVPAAPAGSHEVSIVQGTTSISGSFSVIPSISVSPSSGPVGTVVTISGSGFDAGTPYVVTWTGGAAVCSGSTNSNGGFFCTFSVPASAVGSATILVTEGSYAPSYTFTVAASPPPPAGAAPFPWWIVAVIALVAVALLVLGLLYEQRRHRGARRFGSGAHRGGTTAPWDETSPSMGPAAISTAPAGPGGGGAGAMAGVAVEPEAEPEDIDLLIKRLERMSVQMFHKTPKQLGDPYTTEEATASAPEK